MEIVSLLKKRPWGIIGALLLLVIIVVAVFAPLLAPYDPNDIQIEHRLEPPGSSFLFGTDNLGRDVLSRILWGSQIYLRLGLIAIGAAAVLGLILGFLSGYLGGKTDYILQRALIIPVFFLGAIALLFLIVGTSARFLPFVSAGVVSQFATTIVLVLLAAVFLPSSYNVARKETEAIRHSQPPLHHLPHMLASLTVVALVNLGIAIGIAVLVTTPLSYSGFAPPPVPYWGGMLVTGRQYMITAPWIVLFPSAAIVLSSLGLILFGHAVRDIWIPHL
ncbi:ABC transporter permease [Chloroflexota bacterium]